MTKAELQANLAYPEDIIDASPLSAYPNWIDRNLPFREGFVNGYKQAEKDMKERFIQFVHSHYPINYIGWIQDFQRAMEE